MRPVDAFKAAERIFLEMRLLSIQKPCNGARVIQVVYAPLSSRLLGEDAILLGYHFLCQDYRRNVTRVVAVYGHSSTHTTHVVIGQEKAFSSYDGVPRLTQYLDNKESLTLSLYETMEPMRSLGFTFDSDNAHDRIEPVSQFLADYLFDHLLPGTVCTPTP